MQLFVEVAMVYVNFHLGDWIASTRILSATERGVYLDLLTQYYVNERPITEEECTRIARAYAPAEQEAMHYVLQTFFTNEDGAYRHARCDREIETVAGLSEKKKKAAQARWSKKKTPEHAETCTTGAKDMQAKCMCNADAMQPNTQYPIPNTQDIEESANALPAQASASTPKAPRRKASSACPFLPGAEIPDDYREVAEKAGIGDPQKVFEKFVNHALSTDRRLVDWKAGFRTWCANELQFHPNQKPAQKPLAQRTAADYEDWLS